MPRLTPEAVVLEVYKECAIGKEALIKKGMAIYLSRNHSGIICKELVVCISAMCPVRQ